MRTLVRFGASVALIMLASRRRLKDQEHRRAMAETEFTAILSERNRVARANLEISRVAPAADGAAARIDERDRSRRAIGKRPWPGRRGRRRAARLKHPESS